MRQFRISPRRRGTTLAEVLISASISTVIVGGLIAFSRFQQMTWLDGWAATSTQSAAQLALQRIAPDIRCARRVVTAQSSASRLSLQMPQYAADGSLVVPMQDGELLSYYLSDRTGSPQASGGILWRSVNGVPSSAWALQGTGGRITLGTGGLTFSYLPAVDPTVVTVTINASSTAGTRTNRLSTSQEVLLRNHGL
ncbi:MAG: hypothetical protein K0Q72_1437 [Armatimonadetes bacterium]|jgi:Tfp pilus assembly protein PilV|nr:hypothetical protein [Armatimonadota bacterium]